MDGQLSHASWVFLEVVPAPSKAAATYAIYKARSCEQFIRALPHMCMMQFTFLKSNCTCCLNQHVLIWNISQRGRRKTTRTHPTYFCKYTGQGISSPSGHTSETLDLGFWFYSGLKMHHSALFPALFRQRRNAVLSLMLLHRQNLSMKSKKIIPTWGPFKPEFAIFEYCCA